MPNVSYLTVPRVRQALRSSYAGDDDTVLSDLIGACSAFLDTYCNRASGGFVNQQYDELYHGTGDTILFLNQNPVQSIERIASIKLPCMSVHNTDSDMGSRATVQVNGTPTNPLNFFQQNVASGLTLTYIANAVTTTNTFSFLTYPTVNSLVAAINGAGNHWTAQVMGGFGTLSTADLRATQGAFGARVVTAYVWHWWWDNPWYLMNNNTGEVQSPMGFSRGSFNYRVVYNAGFTTFPDDLSQALAELVAGCYYARELNPNTQSEGIGPMSYSRVSEMFAGLTGVSQRTINHYKVRKVGHYSIW